MNIIIDVDAVNQFKWEKLINDSPTATWFQTKEAYVFFDSLSFLEAFVVAIESEGELKGLVVGYIQKDGDKLKRYFSKRAIILGGLLLAENITEGELGALLCALKDNLKRKAIYIETRNFNDYSQWRKVFESMGFAYEPHYNVQVDTTSIDAVNDRLDRNRRRNIKKALENGLVIDNSPTEQELHAFYALLEKLYRVKVKSPVYPYEFFVKLKELQSSRFFMAKNTEGDILGGLVCVELKGHAVYAWSACGSDQNNRVLSPSVMVNYAGICHAAENGYPRFDFMGAGKPDDGGYGVRDFKLKFGGELVEQGRFVHICSPLLFVIGKMGVKIMKRL